MQLFGYSEQLKNWKVKMFRHTPFRLSGGYVFSKGRYRWMPMCINLHCQNRAAANGFLCVGCYYEQLQRTIKN